MPDMRFAPAPVLVAQSRHGGLNQTNVRSHNERLILDLLRRGKTLSRFEIGQRSGLSAQTVSVLVRALLAEGLLSEGEVHRGRVGPPTTPFSLNPEGAFALGVCVGDQAIDLCCLDLTGNLRDPRRIPIDTDCSIEDQVGAICEAFLAEADPSLRERLMGIGVGLPHAEANAEYPSSIERRLTEQSGLPCLLLDDGSSAATGEVLFGDLAQTNSFAYIHVGLQTSLRVVLNGQAQTSRQEALLVLPGVGQLVEAWPDQKLEDTAVLLQDELPDVDDAVRQEWLINVATDLADTLMPLIAVLDFTRVVCVGPVADATLTEIAMALRTLLSKRGVLVDTATGHNAQYAKASGAAACVLSMKFSPDWV